MISQFLHVLFVTTYTNFDYKICREGTFTKEKRGCRVKDETRTDFRFVFMGHSHHSFKPSLVKKRF